MANAERERPQRERPGGMGHWKQHEPEGPTRPRHVGLHAAREVGTVASFRFATLEPGDGDTAVAVELAAQQLKCMARDRGMVRKVLRDP